MAALWIMAVHSGIAQDQQYNIPTLGTSVTTPVGEVVQALEYRHTLEYDASVITRGAFLRFLNYDLNSDDGFTRQLALQTYDLSDEQAEKYTQIITDWMYHTSSLADIQIASMCDFWSHTEHSVQDAELSLQNYDRNTISIADQRTQLNTVMGRISSELGNEASDRIESEFVKIDTESFSYMTWSDGVRARNNAVEQLLFTCSGAK